MKIALNLFIVAPLLCTAIAGCQSMGSLDRLPALESAAADDAAYRLGPGDHVALIVFGVSELSANDLNVAADGSIALALVGTVKATGLTLNELTEAVSDRLKNGYIHDPKVSMQIVSYRPFYILGEVKAPGEYPYIPGMTVTKAVARAGGFTFRAYEDEFSVTRNGIKYRSTDTSGLLPDDVLTVVGRIF